LTALAAASFAQDEIVRVFVWALVWVWVSGGFESGLWMNGLASRCVYPLRETGNLK